MPADGASSGDAGADDRARIAGLEERIAAELAELDRRRRGEVRGGPPGVRYAFICGCPRSGTTAVATMLNADERLIIGQERYRRVRKLLEPFMFREELFFNPTERETSWAAPWRGAFPGSAAEYLTLRDRWRGGGVLILGDKAPYYHRVLDRLADRFEEPSLVFVLRDLSGVAASYIRRARDPQDHWPPENDHRRAVVDFNEALANARAFVEGRGEHSIHLLRYEEFHAGAPGSLEALYATLGLELSAAARQAHAALVRRHDSRRAAGVVLDDDAAGYLETHRDRRLERWAADLAERQRASAGAVS